MDLKPCPWSFFLPSQAHLFPQKPSCSAHRFNLQFPRLSAKIGLSFPPFSWAVLGSSSHQRCWRPVFCLASAGISAETPCLSPAHSSTISRSYPVNSGTPFTILHFRWEMFNKWGFSFQGLAGFSTGEEFCFSLFLDQFVMLFVLAGPLVWECGRSALLPSPRQKKSVFFYVF